MVVTVVILSMNHMFQGVSHLVWQWWDHWILVQTLSQEPGSPLRVSRRCPLRQVAVWHFAKLARSEKEACPWRSLSYCLSRNLLPFSFKRRLPWECWDSMACSRYREGPSAAVKPWDGKGHLGFSRCKGLCLHRGVWTKRTSWGILMVNSHSPVGWECC